MLRLQAHGQATRRKRGVATRLEARAWAHASMSVHDVQGRGACVTCDDKPARDGDGPPAARCAFASPWTSHAREVRGGHATRGASMGAMAAGRRRRQTQPLAKARTNTKPTRTSHNIRQPVAHGCAHNQTERTSAEKWQARVSQVCACTLAALCNLRGAALVGRRGHEPASG